MTILDYSMTRRMPDLGTLAPVRTPEETNPLVRHERELRDLKRTARCDVDIHTAITRSLRTYVEHLEAQHEGQLIRCARVVEDVAEVYEDGGVYPAAAVYSEEVGTYGGQVGAGGLSTNEVESGNPDPNMATFLQDRGQFDLDVIVRVTCATKEMRIGVRKMLTEAWAPVSWGGGFALIMPMHHNAIASFLLKSAQMVDEPDISGPGLRTVQFMLHARAPWLRLFTAPRMQTRTEGTVFVKTPSQPGLPPNVRFAPSDGAIP